MAFRNYCKCYLQHLFSKLVLKCPWSFNIVKGASCIVPEIMRSQMLRSSRIIIALEVFVTKQQMTPPGADCVKRNYLTFCENPDHRNIDSFLMNLISDLKLENTALNIFFQKILLIFHGNAAVERGFSVNKECLVEHMTEDSLVAHRSVYGAVSSLGTVSDVISRSMIPAIRNSSARRKEVLAKMTEEKDKVEKTKQRAY
ncbi:hypothetical protein PR048_005887 [Dryococelus australis]|uniref:Uncharacterized protein n=1 Tax=Dryococelus australis TaxID=614101 RepID=A0ABQ9I9I8_9NEOP|nr:hypothetical protein PR048_005887 [Dryococelus australis]